MEENKDNKRDTIFASIGKCNEDYDRYEVGDLVKVCGVPHVVTSVETEEDGTRIVRSRRQT